MLSVADSGLWLRQGGEDGQTVIQAARSNLDGTELFGVTFLDLRCRRAAADADRGRDGAAYGNWRVGADRHVKSLGPDRREPRACRDAKLSGPTCLAVGPDAGADQRQFRHPSAIAFWDLPSSYIGDLERAGFSARSLQALVPDGTGAAGLMAAMVLVAAGFTMRHVRVRRHRQMVLYAMLRASGSSFCATLRKRWATAAKSRSIVGRVEPAGCGCVAVARPASASGGWLM